MSLVVKPSFRRAYVSMLIMVLESEKWLRDRVRDSTLKIRGPEPTVNMLSKSLTL